MIFQRNLTNCSRLGKQTTSRMLAINAPNFQLAHVLWQCRLTEVRGSVLTNAKCNGRTQWSFLGIGLARGGLQAHTPWQFLLISYSHPARYSAVLLVTSNHTARTEWRVSYCCPYYSSVACTIDIVHYAELPITKPRAMFDRKQNTHHNVSIPSLLVGRKTLLQFHLQTFRPI